MQAKTSIISQRSGENKSLQALSTRDFGRWGEEYATQYLIDKGYKILDRNFFHSRFGELDIIARLGNVIVFVEVKARRTVCQGYPIEAVNARKLNQMVRASYGWLNERKPTREATRFDVVGITVSGEEVVEVKHIEGVRI